MRVLQPRLRAATRAQSPPDWQEILTYFRGSELQTFLTRILEDNIKAIIKPQYVDNIPKAVQGNVGEVNSAAVRPPLAQPTRRLLLTVRRWLPPALARLLTRRMSGGSSRRCWSSSARLATLRPQRQRRPPLLPFAVLFAASGRGALRS